MKKYDYKWKTAADIIGNVNTKRVFSGWGETTLAEIADTTDAGVFTKAHELWLKLESIFNREAKVYDPELNYSRIGSIGTVTEREVMRSMWWGVLGGDKYGDYDTVTRIIEALHQGETLATGTIHFGS
jgi:hypothetical protein